MPQPPTSFNEHVGQYSLLIATLGLLLVLVATLFPYDFCFNDQDLCSETVSQFKPDFTTLGTLQNLLTNLLLFLPFGFGVTGLMQKRRLPETFKVAVVILAGSGVSALVEFLQVFLPREPTLVDILANSVSMFLGYLCFRWRGPKIYGCVVAFVAKSRRGLSVKILLGAFIGYATFTFPLSFFLQSITNQQGLFINWDQSYPLLLGNEQTGDRPWRGQLFELSIVNKAISKEAVARAFEMSHLAEIEDSLLASYQFIDSGHSYQDQTGHLPDLSWRGEPTNLQGETGVRVGPEGWLETVAPTLTQRMRETSQFSLITQVATADVEQVGPARIVSLSWDPYHRNFTLGQEKRDLVFRLRTPLTGENGMEPELVAHDVFVDRAPHHLVITYDGAVSRLYVDGIQHPHFVNLSPEPGITLFSYLSFNKAHHRHGYHILYYGLIFIPLGILLALVFASKERPTLFSVLVLLSGFLISSLLLEGILVSASGRDPRLENMLLGMFLMACPTFLIWLAGHPTSSTAAYRASH